MASTCWLNSPMPRAQKATSTVLIVRMRLRRANAASIEIGAGLLVLDHLAEDVVLLVLAPGRLLDEERGERGDRDGDAEDEPRPAPALGSAGGRRDGADQHRARQREAVADHVR